MSDIQESTVLCLPNNGIDIIVLIIYIILTIGGLFPLISGLKNLLLDDKISSLFKTNFYIFSICYFSLCIIDINFVFSCKYYSRFSVFLLKCLHYIFYGINVNFSLSTLIIRLYKTFEATIFNLEIKYLYIYLLLAFLSIITSITASILVVFWENTPQIWFPGFILGILSYLLYITTFIIVIKTFIKKLKQFVFETELKKTSKIKYDNIMKITQS